MKRSLFFPGLLLAVTVALAAAAPGCGRNGEGERCSRLNGDEDCNAGLVCTDGSVLGRKSDVCCPPGETSVVPECVPNSSTGGAGGTGGADTTGTGTGGTTSTSGTGGTGGTGGAATGGTGGAATGGTGGTGGM